MIEKNKSGEELLSDGEVLDLVYDLANSWLDINTRNQGSPLKATGDEISGLYFIQAGRIQVCQRLLELLWSNEEEDV